MNAEQYPKNWREIANRIKAAAGWSCVRCGHSHDTKNGYVLTVHHLDGVKSNCEDWNLAALCQRCHLSVQSRVNMDQGFLFPNCHADWMRPYIEGRKRAGKSF